MNKLAVLRSIYVPFFSLFAMVSCSSIRPVSSLDSTLNGFHVRICDSGEWVEIDKSDRREILELILTLLRSAQSFEIDATQAKYWPALCEAKSKFVVVAVENKIPIQYLDYRTGLSHIDFSGFYLEVPEGHRFAVNDRSQPLRLGGYREFEEMHLLCSHIIKKLVSTDEFADMCTQYYSHLSHGQ
jgi:hypothetical protein